MTGDKFLDYLKRLDAKEQQRRYRAALTLIRAADQHRLLTRFGLNTRVDDWDVMEAHEAYTGYGRRLGL